MTTANVSPPPPADRRAPRTTRRVRTPTVLQMEAVECGAAALGMILGYYGLYVPLEQLRADTGVSRDGVKASNILRAARAYGLTAQGYRKEPAELPELPLPMIAFWEFNHFVVVEGFGRNRVYLNDPAVGPRWVSDEEFDESFTGIVLVFAPGPDFKPGGERPNAVRGLITRLAGSWGGLLYVVLAGLLLVIPGLAIPVFTKIFVDDYLVAGLHGWIGPLLLGLALTALLRAALSWLQQHYLLRLYIKLAVGMSGRFLWHALRLPMEFYAQRFAGEIAWRASLNATIAQLLSGQLATALIGAMTSIFYVMLMLWYSVPLTLIGILFAVLNVVALRYVQRSRVDANRRLLLEQGKLMAVSTAGLQAIETLKANGGESDFFARWAGYQAKMLNAVQELGAPTQVVTVVPSLLSALSTATILAVGGLQVMNGALSVGTLVAFQSLMVSFTQPFSTLVSLGAQIQEAQGGIERLDDVLRNPIDRRLVGDAAPPEAAARAGANGDAPARLAGRIELRNITFGYSRLTEPLIENFNLTVEPGQRVALVGKSGSGKSTVSRLVTGLLEPWSGEVVFDGVPRDTLPRAVLADSVALVAQEIFLFAGTVTENLTLWDGSIPRARVLQAAKDACIHDDVAARPGGYESLVEEGGSNFSGGQAQRLEIARGLAANPSILVLDEATASLDPLTELRIDGNLRRRGCTCLIIAHRLSTIRDADEIIVLDQGKVVERGTHDQLKNQGGLYAQLIAS